MYKVCNTLHKGEAEREDIKTSLNKIDLYYMFSLTLYDKLRNKLLLIGLLCVLAVISYYNILWVIHATSYGSFYEPDNYMYYKYALEMVEGLPQTNTQIIGMGTLPFFEHPGLYQTPAALTILFHIPLVWAFRILMFSLIICNMILIYKFVHRFYEVMLLPQTLEYFGLMLSFLFPLLVYQFEPIEWRGNLFLTTISLLMAWLFFKQYTSEDRRRKVTYLMLSILLIPISWYMWSAWYGIIPLFFSLMFVFTYMPNILTSKKRIIYVSASLVITLLLLFVFYKETIALINSIAGNYIPSCINNPIHISEMECLTPTNGLTLVVASAVIFFLGLIMTWRYSIKKCITAFYVYMLIAVGISWLPLTMLYLRIITLLSPFLAIAFGIGYSVMQYRSGSDMVGKIIFIVISLTVILGLVYFIYAYYVQAHAQYLVDNPSFLPQVGNILNEQNGTLNLLTFYAYGDWFETYTKANVYADTIQGLNYTRIDKIDSILLANSTNICSLLSSLHPEPNYVLVSKMFKGYVILENASNSSLLEDPNILLQCGFRNIYSVNNTTLWSR